VDPFSGAWALASTSPCAVAALRVARPPSTPATTAVTTAPVASSRQTPSHQLHARYASYGADAAQAFDGLVVRWCGSATDATGADVAVAVRVWVGGRWVDAAVAGASEGCVEGSLAAPGIADVIFDDDRGLVVEVLPRVTRTGPLEPALTTTTLHLTTFVVP
jgi:hypothetical protein